LNKPESQQDFLRRAKKELADLLFPQNINVTWDKFAEIVEIKPRALMTYRWPDGSKDGRELPPFTKAAIEKTLTEYHARYSSPIALPKPGDPKPFNLAPGDFVGHTFIWGPTNADRSFYKGSKGRLALLDDGVIILISDESIEKDVMPPGFVRLLSDDEVNHVTGPKLD